MKEFMRQKKYISLADEVVNHITEQRIGPVEDELGISIESDNALLKKKSILSFTKNYKAISEQHADREVLEISEQIPAVISPLAIDSELASKSYYPKTHRAGLTGRFANLALHKLYLATSTFFSSVFRHQESVNRQTIEKVNELSNTTNELTRTVNELSNTTNELTGALNKLSNPTNELSGTVNELSNPTNELSGTVNELSNTTNELTGTVNKLSHTINEHLSLIHISEPTRPY